MLWIINGGSLPVLQCCLHPASQRTGQFHWRIPSLLSYGIEWRFWKISILNFFFPLMGHLWTHAKIYSQERFPEKNSASRGFVMHISKHENTQQTDSLLSWKSLDWKPGDGNLAIHRRAGTACLGCDFSIQFWSWWKKHQNYRQLKNFQLTIFS